MNLPFSLGLRDLLLPSSVSLCVAFAMPPANAAAQARFRSETNMAVQAEGRGKPYLNLQDGREMEVEYVGDQRASAALRSGETHARALASADLDGNGTPDLVAGYANASGGIVTVQRGNPDAFPERAW